MPFSSSTGSSNTADERQAATDGSTVARGAILNFRFGDITYPGISSAWKWIAGLAVAIGLYLWLKKKK